MSFVESGIYMKRERFSLLLLEPGEIYFEDFSALCDPQNGKESTSNKKGMLKICSKSVIFDPKDEGQPILKFLYRDIIEIKQWESPNDFYRCDAALMLETNQVVEMKPENQIAPYIFKREHMKYIFRLEWSHTEDCVPQMCQLLRASTLPIADQTAMISAIVMHRQQLVPFDKSWLESLFEDIIFETQCDQIRPLVVNPGRLMLTTERLYFQPFNNADPQPVMQFKLAHIQRIIKRRFLLRHVDTLNTVHTGRITPTEGENPGVSMYILFMATSIPASSDSIDVSMAILSNGLELFCSDCHLYLAFKTPSERENLYSALRDQVQLSDLGQQNMTLRWQNGIISNLEYLTYLNSLADRSTNDLTQYPVFPWVIKDFTSDTLDLTKENVFRDLHKPIGALNEERLERLESRYNEMPAPKFLYGSHYSTPGYVLYYLVRAAPEYMLCLQNGRFDQPDRMFNSIADAWNNCQTSYSDFKELVPEFFEGKGDFLSNSQNIDFGVRQDGTCVGDVKLPPWAEDRQDFIKKQRDALESDYVSRNLHHWIDLIFGYKQQGPEAEKANNIFFYLTYEGAVDLDSIVDLDERAALEQQIMEFGQTPKQLFKLPHPARVSPVRLALKETTVLSENTHDFSTKLNSTGESVNYAHFSNIQDPFSISGTEPHSSDSEKTKETEIKITDETFNRTTVSNVSEAVSANSLPEVKNITLSTILVTQDICDTETKSHNSYIKNLADTRHETCNLESSGFSHLSNSFCDTLNEGAQVNKYGCQSCGLAIICDSNHMIEKLSECKHHNVHRSPVSCLKWRGDGEVLYSADQDGCIKMYSWAEQQQLQSVNLSSMCLSAMVEINDTQSLLVASWDNYLYLYSFEFGRLLSSTPAHDDAVSCLSMSSDQSHLVTGSWDSTIKIWECQNSSGRNACQFVLKGEFDHDSSVTCVNQTPDCNQIVTSTGDGVVTVWDTHTQTPLVVTRPHSEAINGQQFNHDHTRVVTAGSDQLLTITDIQTGAQIFSTSVNDTPRCVCWQGDLVAVGTDGGDVQVWDVTQGKHMYNVNLQGPVTCIAESQLAGIATGGATGQVTLVHTLLT